MSAKAQEDNSNVYEEPRAMVQKEFYGQYGKTFKASDFKGKFTLMVFWSKHCAPCIKEFDNLNNFANIVQDHGIQIIPVSLEGEWSEWQKSKDFMTRYNAPDLDSYLDRKGDLAADLGIFRFPHTVILNKKGQEIGRIRGAVEWDDPKVIEYIYRIKASSN